MILSSGLGVSYNSLFDHMGLICWYSRSGFKKNTSRIIVALVRSPGGIWMILACYLMNQDSIKVAKQPYDFRSRTKQPDTIGNILLPSRRS
jgi:hypothetical protein